MQTQSVAKTADHMEEERQADTAKQEVQQISSATSEDRRRSLFADILCRMCHRQQTVFREKKRKKEKVCDDFVKSLSIYMQIVKAPRLMGNVLLLDCG